MLVSQLSAAGSVQRLGRPKLSAIQVNAALTLVACGQRRHFWRNRRQWESPLDPEFLLFHRKRHQRARAALRDALRRRSKWLYGAREASHWSKKFKGWPTSEQEHRKGGDTQNDYELSSGEKRWKKRVDAVKKLADSDPYRAIFGRSLDPSWSSSMWNSILPKRAGVQTDSSTQAYSNDLKSNSEIPGSSPDFSSAYRDSKGKIYAESSSFSYSSSREPGKAPVIKASSSKWDSDSNATTTYHFDPVTNRMVSDQPVDHESVSGKPTSSVDIPVKNSSKSSNASYPTSSTADSLRASMDRRFEAQSQNVDQQIEEARQALGKEAMSKIKQAPSSSKSSKKTPQNIRDALSVLDGYSDKPIGMQTSFATEKEAKGSNYQSLAEEISGANANVEQPDGYSTRPMGMQSSYSTERKAGEDYLSEEIASKNKAVDVEDGYSKDPIGMQTSYSAEQRSDKLPLDQELSSNTAPVDLEDGYSREPIGMQTSYSSETHSSQPSLDHELSHNIVPVDTDDGYSKKPIGMQTSYSTESNSDQPSLDQELSSNTRAVDVDDGYSKEPIGMQTSYSTETHSNRPSLDQELSSNTKPIELDDGYSKKPIGMQTSYSGETHDALEQEISKREIPVDVEDGYSKAPIGMQTSFSGEQHDALEQEISRREIPVDVEDGYSKSPIGMQTSFTEERQAITDHKQIPLDQEISENVVAREIPDGYSNEPIGMQTSYRHEQEDIESHLRKPLEEEILHPTEVPFDDGYSNKPMGMQTNFETEQQDIADHKRLPLEEEINAKPVDEDDGYTNKAFGLQNTFEKEQEDVKKGRPSLEEEIELNDRLAVEANLGLAGQYKDGYTNQRRGLQTSYGQEYDDYAGGKRVSLEEELRSGRIASKAWRDHSQQTPRGLQFLYGQESQQYQPPLDPTVHRQKIAAREMLENEVEAQKFAMRSHETSHTGSMSQTISKRPFHAAADGSGRPLQGEGDMSGDVARFANRDKWYKQNSSNSNEVMIQEIVRICADNGLLGQHNELQKVQERLLGKLRSLEDRLKTEPRTRSEQDIGDSFKWAEPPSYKILAYDSGNDAIQTVTTTSRFSDKERPISVPKAMSKVREPARFVSHFAGLQKDGYQAIYASDDLLVLRKAQYLSEHKDAPASAAEPSLAAPSVNPVDGTARQPATGNFASPTGFVNHDPIFPIEAEGRAAEHSQLPDSEIQDGIYYRHYPRVRRQEPVFSGRRINDDGHHRQRGYRRERRAAWKRRVRFAVSVGATSAVVVYALGVGAELAKDKNGGA
ncbi:hypothetical protein K461DRAFT_279614 [Myriangium duriaei CBS 260.36]|uniref:Uncharacterized protein n=1 Tax=Myriangium duriaei CBS 260.36 TaxID=1168546 RepID=A0A9P4J465_9PEZI|nr:hypothetical protein K461DRAFT_279614 [Myriangium duriaei CBS 260.36]